MQHQSARGERDERGSVIERGERRIEAREGWRNEKERARKLTAGGMRCERERERCKA